MRKINLTKDEAGVVYTVLNQPANPQQGLSIKEVRKLSPILDKLESAGDLETDAEGTESLRFGGAIDLELKESEYMLVKDRVENSSGWVNAMFVRKVVSPLLEKIEECEKLPDAVKKEEAIDDEKNPPEEVEKEIPTKEK